MLNIVFLLWIVSTYCLYYVYWTLVPDTVLHTVKDAAMNMGCVRQWGRHGSVERAWQSYIEVSTNMGTCTVIKGQEGSFNMSGLIAFVILKEQRLRCAGRCWSSIGNTRSVCVVMLTDFCWHQLYYESHGRPLSYSLQLCMTSAWMDFSGYDGSLVDCKIYIFMSS